MESLLQIIFILSFVKFACKATFFPKYWGIVLFAALAGVFAYSIHPFVIKNEIQLFTGIFSEKAKVTNLAIVITAEAVSGIMISIAVLQKLTGVKKRTGTALLKLLPGVTIAGAVFYIELKTFYFFPGIDFRVTALIISAGLFLMLGLIAAAIKFFLPDKAMRYEFKFFINMLLLIMAVLLNAGLAVYNRSSYHTELVWTGLLTFLLLVVGLFAVGYFVQKMKNKGKLKKLHQWI